MHDLPGRTHGRLGAGSRALIAAFVCATAVMAAVIVPRAAQAAEGTTTVYRLYNQWTKEHFYTTSADERVGDMSIGWRNEGVGWTAPQSGETTVYRLFNKWTKEHLYTASAEEKDGLVDDGWTEEDPLCFGATEDTPGAKPVYRLYNKWNPVVAQHHYTTSETEKDNLVKSGWEFEGEKWYALEDGEQPLAIGSFFVNKPGSTPDFETVLCATRDGYNFTQISTPFTTSQNPFHDPSIMYKDGWFYLLSNMNLQDGRFHPMISYSKDLREWSEPEGASQINGGSYNGIPLESMPFGIQNFDVVAPEWFQAPNGDVYIVFSAGYYGDFHGQPMNDRMKPYAVKVDISHDGLAPWTGGLGNRHLPLNLTLDFTQAFEIKGLDASENYIDGSMYAENGKYYLLIKKNGENNQIYENSTMGPTGWHKVKDNLSFGNEGPSLMKFDGAYLLYTDKIATSRGSDGVQVSASTGIANDYSSPQDVGGPHLRHGTVINLTGDAKAIGEAFVGDAL